MVVERIAKVARSHAEAGESWDVARRDPATVELILTVGAKHVSVKAPSFEAALEAMRQARLTMAAFLAYSTQPAPMTSARQG